jgi:Delta7-sterol 5-desaturase
MFTPEVFSALGKFFMLLSVQFGRYVLLAGGAFLLYYIWKRKAYLNNRIQSAFPKTTDFWREIRNSLMSSVLFTVLAYLIATTDFMNYTLAYRNLNDYPLWYLPVSVMLALMLHDTYFYWMHRLFHHPALFQWVHVEHHKSTNPSPWAAYSFHILEAASEMVIAPLILFLIPMHPIGLLLFGTAALFINIYGHLGFEIAPKWFRHSFLFEVLNSSVHHNLHHSKFKGNYGLYFRFWDRVMGTENPTYQAECDRVHAKRFALSAHASQVPELPTKSLPSQKV